MIAERETLKNMMILLGRILLATIFIVAGVHKAIEYTHGSDSYIKFITSEISINDTIAHAMVIAAIVIEIVGGLLVLLGYKVRLGACMLLIFLIPATLIFHDFWENSNQPNDIHHFLKNAAIFGGLLYVAAVGAGKYSLSCCGKCEGSCKDDSCKDGYDNQ